MSKATTDHYWLPRFGDRRVMLYRRTDLKDSGWYMRVYLASEERYYRKALDTHSRDEAATLAQAELIRVLTRMESGLMVLSISVARLVQEYLKVLDNQKNLGEIRPATYDNACHRIDLCRRFLAEKLEAGIESKLSSVDGATFDEYMPWRFENVSKVRRDVVVQELGTMKQMFKWAVRKKYCRERVIPSWEIKTETEKAKRDRIGEQDAYRVLELASQWSREACLPKVAYNRSLMFHLLMVMNCSGMRTGEILQLRRRSVGKLYDGHLCNVTIQFHTSKRQKERDITIGGMLSGTDETARNVNFLHEWMKHSHHKKPDDFVFAHIKDGQKSAADPLAKYYNQFRKEMLESAGLAHVDIYSQRHAFISDRLRAGATLIKVAEYCGTSPRMLSQTYSHITGIESSKEMLAKTHTFRD